MFCFPHPTEERTGLLLLFHFLHHYIINIDTIFAIMALLSVVLILQPWQIDSKYPL